jgi:hypothetical protein
MDLIWSKGRGNNEAVALLCYANYMLPWEKKNITLDLKQIRSIIKTFVSCREENGNRSKIFD